MNGKEGRKWDYKEDRLTFDFENVKIEVFRKAPIW